MKDVYAKDISRKIITSFKARQEKGEYLPAFPPYGYVKSKTRAYRYKVDKGYETPAAYYRRKNPGTKKFANVSELACWNIYSVNKILQNKVYYGVVV